MTYDHSEIWNDQETEKNSTLVTAYGMVVRLVSAGKRVCCLYRVSTKGQVEKDDIPMQKRFDNHVDKLMNYIRYWQASGESLKTSIRTKTRLGQIVQEGRFRGGCAPCGYQLIKKGRMGKKNRELYDIEINPDEGRSAAGGAAL